jgi:hypothetical protein
MNMFRNILTAMFFALGLGLWFIPAGDWQWVDMMGGQAVVALHFMFDAQPFSTIVFLVIATALFMTRKQY